MSSPTTLSSVVIRILFFYDLKSQSVGRCVALLVLVDIPTAFSNEFHLYLVFKFFETGLISTVNSIYCDYWIYS